jgi:hypothetical protein
MKLPLHCYWCQFQRPALSPSLWLMWWGDTSYLFICQSVSWQTDSWISAMCVCMHVHTCHTHTHTHTHPDDWDLTGLQNVGLYSIIAMADSLTGISEFAPKASHGHVWIIFNILVKTGKQRLGTAKIKAGIEFCRKIKSIHSVQNGVDQVFCVTHSQ